MACVAFGAMALSLLLREKKSENAIADGLSSPSTVSSEG
jgi:hypothetical protein